MIDYSFYVHGGQDIKEGAFNDMWRVNLQFLDQSPSELKDEHEIYDIQWEQVKTSGNGPKPISHHSGILQEQAGYFIVYGGIV
jgi:hypothetical protein